MQHEKKHVQSVQNCLSIVEYENLLRLVADVAGAKRKSRSRDLSRVILRSINLVVDQSN